MRAKTLICKILENNGVKNINSIKDGEVFVGKLKDGYAIVTYDLGMFKLKKQKSKSKEFDLCTTDIYM